MQCHEFDRVLEQQLAGPFPEDAAAHLEICDACRALTADLSAIHAAARALDTEEDEEFDVPEAVWISLRQQLEREGIIRKPAVLEQTQHKWWFSFQHPAFAGGFLAIVLLAAGLVSYQSALGPTANVTAQSQQPIQFGDAAVPGVSAELRTVVNETVSELSNEKSDVTASLRRNLEIVDTSIAMCEKSVREEPKNEIAREYLYGAYQQKADLLATAMNHSTTGGLQ